MNNVIRIIENPAKKGYRVIPSTDARGIVEELDWMPDDDGHHVVLRQTLWTRNLRRSLQDQRGEIIDQKILLRLTAQEAATLQCDLTWTLIHVDSQGPKREDS